MTTSQTAKSNYEYYYDYLNDNFSTSLDFYNDIYTKSTNAGFSNDSSTFAAQTFHDFSEKFFTSFKGDAVAEAVAEGVATSATVLGLEAAKINRAVVETLKSSVSTGMSLDDAIDATVRTTFQAANENVNIEAVANVKAMKYMLYTFLIPISVASIVSSPEPYRAAAKEATFVAATEVSMALGRQFVAGLEFFGAYKNTAGAIIGAAIAVGAIAYINDNWPQIVQLAMELYDLAVPIYDIVDEAIQHFSDDFLGFMEDSGAAGLLEGLLGAAGGFMFGSPNGEGDPGNPGDGNGGYGDGNGNGADGGGLGGLFGAAEAVADAIDGAVAGAANLVNAAMSRSSPLVLDLDGDGIELTAFSSISGAYFDLDEDGFAEQTAWVSKDDGLLAYDVNKNGRIDSSSELFGSSNTDGFSELKEFDVNGDGVINEADPIWNKLVIWKDDNENGQVEDGELHQLSEFNILSINVNATEVSETNQGNSITHSSSYTYDTGSGTATRDIKDVWFTHSNLNSHYVGNEEYEFDTLVLPNSRGYGELMSLHAAMSVDDAGVGNLFSLMNTLYEKDFDDIFVSDNSIIDDVKEILFRWAGVSDVDPDSRGNFVDARELGFLEKFLGEKFSQRGIYTNPTGIEAGFDTQQAFHDLLVIFYSRFVAQGAGSELFEGKFTYEFLADKIEGVTGLNLGKLVDLQTEATGLASTSEKEVFWKNIVAVIENVIGVENLSIGDLGELTDAINASDISITLSEIMDSLNFVREAGLVEPGTNSADIFVGGSSGDFFTGLEGNDTFTGNAGNDFLVGNSGDDIYIYNAGDGFDTIKDSSGTDDRIEFGSTIDLSDINFVRAGNSDLLIEIDNGVFIGSIVIEDQFTTDTIEELRFSSLATYDLLAQNWTLYGTSKSEILLGVEIGTGRDDTIYGEGGNDTINGFDGADILYGGDGNDLIDAGSGNDTLYGDAGNDELKGGDGNDEYHFLSGNDIIFDNSGTDEIVLSSSFSSAVYLRFGNDLKIVLNSSNSVYIVDQYVAGHTIEDLTFQSSSTTIALSSITPILQGTSGIDTFTGGSGVNYSYGLEGDDDIYGGAGNDLLDGGDGNDYISGGNDDDTLYGGLGNDKVLGGAGNDFLSDGGGDDEAEGGSGNDTFVYTSGIDLYTDTTGTDILQMANGWVLADVSFKRYSTQSNDLVIEINSTNKITIQNQFALDDNIDTMTFSDSTTINLITKVYETYGDNNNNTVNGITNGGSINDILFGLDGNDTLNGNNGDDILYGGNGNDIVRGGNNNDILDGGAGNDTLEGGTDAGNDTFIFSGGIDTVEDNGGTDTLKIVGGATINDLTTSTTGNHVKFIVNTGVDEVTLRNLLNGTTSYHIERIAFDDGFNTNVENIVNWIWGTSSAETLTGNSSANTLIGKAGDDTINGGDGNDDIHGGVGNDNLSGGNHNDLIFGGEGNDTLDGGSGNDTLNGGEGNDVYNYSAGLDTIVDMQGTDILNIGNALTINDISLTSMDKDLKIVITATTDELTITNQNASYADQIERIQFDDGFSTTLSDYSFWKNGTGSADTITGTSGHNTILGNAGNDILDGAGGDDDIHGGAGNDILKGGSGVDLVHGGAGEDSIYGQDGLDTLYGGTGADTFIFEATSAFNDIDVIKDFNTGQSDKLNIADLLTGYTSGVSDIDDFMSITIGGGHSSVFIDRDGSGSTYSSTQIATLSNVTGLIVEDLLTNGNLIAA